MQCDCKKDLEQRLKTRVTEMLEGKHGKNAVTDLSASLEGYALILSNPAEERVSITYKGEAWVPKKSGGKKRVKIAQNILATYCPFCGQRAEAKDEDTAS